MFLRQIEQGIDDVLRAIDELFRQGCIDLNQVILSPSLKFLEMVQ